jgi:hypothetical protein
MGKIIIKNKFEFDYHLYSDFKVKVNINILSNLNKTESLNLFYQFKDWCERYKISTRYYDI